MCGIRERVWRLSRCESQCISVSGFQGGSVVAGSGLELGACRSAAADVNLDQRWQFTEGGQIINPEFDLCVTPGDQGLPPTLQPCAKNKPLWKRGPLDQVVSIVDPNLCLTVGIAGEPDQLPPSGTPLRLDFCDNGVGEQFALSATPTETPIPMLPIGVLVALGLALGVSLGVIGTRRQRARARARGLWISA